MRGKRFLFRLFTALACLTACISFLLLVTFSEKAFHSKFVIQNATSSFDRLEAQIKALEEEVAAQKKESAHLLQMIEKMGIVKEREKARIIPKGDGRVPIDEQNQISSEKSILFGTSAPPIPILVIACNRPTVSRCLDKLLEYRPEGMEDQFPIYVSQDCGDASTADVIRNYGAKLTHLEHDGSTPLQLDKKEAKWKGYYLIARHYKWALQQMFKERSYSATIIVEDDLEISPDFYEYFLATYPLLLRDKSLFCVSAWNDNGKKNLIDASAADLLYRSDFFPGLGWMLTKEVWDELEPKWPRGYWDDWIRQPDQIKGRACIRPEVSRTSTFGRKGVSLGQFFDKHLKYIVLNSIPVQFTRKDLSYLLKEKYDEDFHKTVYSAPVVDMDDLRRGVNVPEGNGTVRVVYNSRPSFKRITKALGLMDDFKSGVPRTAYKGVISVFFNGRRVYLAPPLSWKAYDLTWA